MASERRPRRPWCISQLLYLLPDGDADPASNSDCGETCVASLLETVHQLRISPGCLRQSLRKPTADGRTTDHDVAWLLNALSIPAARQPVDSKVVLTRKVGIERSWVILLGNWISWSYQHWMLFYDYGPNASWAMDPWTGLYRKLTDAEFQSRSSLVGVVVHDQVGRPST